MSPDSKTQTPQAKTSGGLLGRIFGRGEHDSSGTDAHSGNRRKAPSISPTFKASSSAATGCRWCGISY